MTTPAPSTKPTAQTITSKPTMSTMPTGPGMMTPFTGGSEYPGMFPWGTNYMPMVPWNAMTPYGGYTGNLERDMFNMRANMVQMMDNMWRAFSNELTFMPSRPGSVMENYYLTNPIRTDPEGNRWLNCCLDLRSFKPEEINVTFNPKERCISVEANHEVKESKDHYVKRHYSRKLYLPESVAGDLSKVEVKSSLTNEGMLYVEAPLPKALTGPTTPEMQTGGAVAPIKVKVI